MSSKDLHGVIVAMITPLDQRENVDEAALRRLIRRLINAGVHCLFAGGSAGEGPLLADGQWRRMMEIAMDEVRGDVALLGGVMDTSSRRVREKIHALREIGYRYFVLTPTYYITIKTGAEHLRLFGEAKESAGDMEMIAYNIPQCTASELAAETVGEMARRGWIRYCKESSGNIDYFRELVRCGKEAGFSVLEGDEATMAEGLRAGARGVVPVCANVFPKLFLRAYDASCRGDAAALNEAQESIRRVRDVVLLGGTCWLSGIKYAAATLGIGSGRAVSPLEPPTADQKRKIDELMTHARSEL